MNYTLFLSHLLSIRYKTGYRFHEQHWQPALAYFPTTVITSQGTQPFPTTLTCMLSRMLLHVITYAPCLRGLGWCHGLNGG